jgi:hypothetical protein
MPLSVTIPEQEYYDPVANEFIYTKETKLVLEHSLVSLSKWESKWHKPFIRTEKTVEELQDYVRCMTINSGTVDPNVYRTIPQIVMNRIIDYINDPMTATTFRDDKRGNPRQIMTAEVIYDLMRKYGIWKECEKWHLSRLITLIRVAVETETPKKKRSRREIMAENRLLNEQRRKARNSRG